MKFKINSGYFFDAISELSRCVLTKANPQIMGGIRISAHSEGLTMIVSNHDFFLRKEFYKSPDGYLSIEKQGSFVAPAKYLVELIRKLPGEITIELKGNNRLIINAEEIRVNLSCFNIDEYPLLPKMNGNQSIHLTSNFHDMVRQTAFAASLNDNRPVLTGIQISFLVNKLRCSATNSHRLAMQEIEMENDFEGSYIVPLPSIKEFLRLFNDCNTVTIQVSATYLVFKTKNLSLYTRLIEGNYPNLSSIIPLDLKTTITLAAREFLIAIDRASVFTRESRNNNVKMELLEGRKLRIASCSTDLGTIEQTLLIKDLQGNPEMSVSLNSLFLIEAIKSIPDEEITISFSGSMRPVIIKPNSNKQHIQLISPVRG